MSAVEVRIGRTDKGDVIDSALDLALEEMGQQHTFKSMWSESDLTIVADDDEVSLPAETLQVVEARLIDDLLSQPFPLYAKTWVVEKWPNIAARSTGKPRFGYEDRGVIKLYPESDGEYTLRVTVIALPTLAAGDASEPTVAHVNKYLINSATAETFRSVESYEAAAVWDRRADRALKMAIRFDRKRVDVRRFDQHGTEFSQEPPPVPEGGDIKSVVTWPDRGVLL